MMNMFFRRCRFTRRMVLLAVLLGMTGGCVTDRSERITNSDQPKAETPRMITGVQITREADAVVVMIYGNAMLSYTSVKQSSPLGVAMYFPDTATVSGLTPVLPAGIDVIDGIAAVQMPDVMTSKINVTLKQDIPYQVVREGNNLKVIFEQAAPADYAEEPPPGIREVFIPGVGTLHQEANGLSANPAALTRTYPVESSGKNVSGKARNEAWVNRIDFSSGEKGKSTVIIGTTHKAEYRVEKLSPNSIQLRLLRTHISDYRKLPLITTRFDSALDRIRPMQASSRKESDALIVFDLREAVPYTVEQDGNLIRVHFEPSSISPMPAEEVPPSLVVKNETQRPEISVLPPVVKTESAADHSSGSQPPVAAIPVVEKSEIPPAASIPANPPVMAAAEAPVPIAGMQTAVEQKNSSVYHGDTPKVYTGEKIGIDLFDTDIRNVFRLLADFSNVNFAIDKDVQGKVTLALAKPVPWDQVLDLVLKMNQLDKVQENGVIRIARVETLEKEEKTRQDRFDAEVKARQAKFDADKKAKEQSLELEPILTEYIPVSYANALKDILPHVRGMSSKAINASATATDNTADSTDKAGSNRRNREGCSITVDERTNQLIVMDTAAKIKQIRAVVEQLDQVTPQVLIEAKIVEATMDFSRQIGTNWGAGWGIQNSDPRAGIGPQPGYNTLGGTYGGTSAVNFPASSNTTGSLGFNFTRLAGTPLVLSASLQAMETTNKGKIISTPKVMTLDNKKAHIEQGLEIGYLVPPTTAGAPATTAFKDVKLTLDVTPHVSKDNRVSLLIDIKKSDIYNYTSTGIPDLTTKAAMTELLVDDGDTLVIGGITKASDTKTNTGVPWLSKIPVMGYLFNSTDDAIDNSELLIFITPRIVQLEQKPAKSKLLE